MSSADRTARALDAIPTLDLPVGLYISANADGTVQIDFGEGAVNCLSAGTFEPLAGTSVRCIRTDVGTVMLGAAAPRLSYGTVVTAGSPLLTVSVAGTNYSLPYLSSYTPRNVADAVMIDWNRGGVVLGVPSQIPSSSYVPAGGVAQPFTADFRAYDSGSYRSGSWWTTDVRCSSGNKGAWFYGSTIADTIPDGATVTRVQLYVNEYYNEFPSSLATIGLHTLLSKAGAPTVTDTVTISAGSGWKDLPAAFGTLLKTGAKYGVGTNEGGFHKFRAVALDADSGLLRIDWTV